MQQDAHEALIKILHVLHNTTISHSDSLNLSQSSQPSSAVNKTFHGYFKITFTCPSCNRNSVNVEPFQDIVVDPVVNISRSLVASFKETITKYCINCNCDTEHAMCRDIWAQPDIMVIRVNRFKQTSRGRICKNNSVLSSSETLTLDTGRVGLIGVIFHHGSTTASGHYTSVVKVNNVWYRCNDNSVEVVEFTDICDSKESYILFYNKV